MSVITTISIKANNNFTFDQIPGLDMETGRLHLKTFMESEKVQNLIPNISNPNVNPTVPEQVCRYMTGLYLDYTDESIIVPSRFAGNELRFWANYNPYIVDIMSTFAEMFPGTTFYGRESMEGDRASIKVVCNNNKLEFQSTRYYDCQDQEPQEKPQKDIELEAEFKRVWDLLDNMPK